VGTQIRMHMNIHNLREDMERLTWSHIGCWGVVQSSTCCWTESRRNQGQWSRWRWWHDTTITCNFLFFPIFSICSNWEI